jgi:hypothetical protein
LVAGGAHHLDRNLPGDLPQLGLVGVQRSLGESRGG